MADYSSEVKIGELVLNYYDIHRKFTDSKYGPRLAKQTRWEIYKPKRMSDQEWHVMLGADSNNLAHMPFVFEIAKEIIERIKPDLSEIDKQDLLYTSMVHNWGKVDVGDITYERKTSEHIKFEHEVFERVYQEILATEEKLNTSLSLLGGSGRLASIFKVIERCGYLKTALKVNAYAKQPEYANIKINLHWLVSNVLINQIPKLINDSFLQDGLKAYLLESTDDISDAFYSIGESVFNIYKYDKDRKIEQFNLAKKVWFDFLNNRRSQEEIAKEVTSGNDSIEPLNKGIFTGQSKPDQRYIPDFQRIKKVVNSLRTFGMRIVLTQGTFDLIHIGHVLYLEKAKEYGDILIVGVDSDVKVKKRKGPDRPVVPEHERIEMLTHLRSVDIVTKKTIEHSRWELIKTVEPDVLIATEETYSADQVKQLKEFCKEIVVLEPQATTSTTAKLRRLQIGFADKLASILPQKIKKAIEELIQDA